MWSYLGQNFLIDSKVRTYIAEHIQSLYSSLGCEALIEIGPGKGAITKLILDISDNFFVIEKDVSLAQSLEVSVQNWVQSTEHSIQSWFQNSKPWTNLLSLHSEYWTHFNIIQGDVLEIDVDTLLQNKNLDTKKTLVVGNLPYYITSPILRKFFGEGRQYYAWWIFMLQDEVGQKLRSDAKKKSYLRWMINYAYDVVYLKWVPAKCFKPAPKVKSCLVQLTTKSEKLKVSWSSFLCFLELYAPFSRKTLGSIEKIVTKRSLEKNSSKSNKIDQNWGTLRKIEENWRRSRVFEPACPVGREDGGKSWKEFCLFSIPETLKKRRLEELNFEDIALIIK